MGRRLQAPPDREVAWEAHTEEAAKSAIASVVSVRQSGEFGWLTSVATVRDYAFESIANPQSSIDDFELALVLAREGETNRRWWSAEKILQQMPEPDESEYLKSLRDKARQLQAAIKNNSVGQLLEKLHEVYIERNKLCADTS